MTGKTQGSQGSRGKRGAVAARRRNGARALKPLVCSPELKMPALTQFVDGSGPVWSGNLFPFLFITIACGAVSGFHALISSGTTPKLIENETQARYIGYGGMLMESFVAIMGLHMQRASGLGRAWIIAAALANPIVENSGFLALLIPYVDKRPWRGNGAAGGGRRRGRRIRGNIGCFGGF
ncbi:carbon starvation CstA family protein [Lactiplantibacillus plantarum]|uniref:carbon starvation CstA family protein n=1 Tax=Lactiplantibacillus plantarum TaxID=1590 RepID=UPI004045F73D